MDVVYEDNHLIIVDKSSSEIVQGDKTGALRTNLSDMAPDTDGIRKFTQPLPASHPVKLFTELTLPTTFPVTGWLRTLTLSPVTT